METEYKEFESINFASTVDNLVQAESLVDRVCSTLSVKEDHYGNILIAVTEAVNNAIKHGNRENRDKKVSLAILNSNEAIEIIVKDQGVGFDFNNLPDPTAPENIEKEHGRGIFLMRTLADEVTFDDNGRVVKMIFSKS